MSFLSIPCGGVKLFYANESPNSPEDHVKSIMCTPVIPLTGAVEKIVSYIEVDTIFSYAINIYLHFQHLAD